MTLLERLLTNCTCRASLAVVSSWDMAILSGADGVKSNIANMAKYLQAQIKAGRSELKASNNTLTQAMKLIQQATFNINNNTDIGLGWFVIKHKEHKYYFLQWSHRWLSRFYGLFSKAAERHCIIS